MIMLFFFAYDSSPNVISFIVQVNVRITQLDHLHYPISVNALPGAEIYVLVGTLLKQADPFENLAGALLLSLPPSLPPSIPPPLTHFFFLWCSESVFDFKGGRWEVVVDTIVV